MRKTKKQRLAAMEGKHHDKHPRYSRKPKCPDCQDTGWINTEPMMPWPAPVPCGCDETE